MSRNWLWTTEHNQLTERCGLRSYSFSSVKQYCFFFFCYSIIFLAQNAFWPFLNAFYAIQSSQFSSFRERSITDFPHGGLFALWGKATFEVRRFTPRYYPQSPDVDRPRYRLLIHNNSRVTTTVSIITRIKSYAYHVEHVQPVRGNAPGSTDRIIFRTANTIYHVFFFLLEKRWRKVEDGPINSFKPFFYWTHVAWSVRDRAAVALLRHIIPKYFICLPMWIMAFRSVTRKNHWIIRRFPRRTHMDMINWAFVKTHGTVSELASSLDKWK